jgi:pyruvate dehydrogenase E2 component (dihydrolipoamide acetyltransferase)
MPMEITMPKLSDTMEEGTVLKWHIKEGDRVARGDIIAEVETDKAAMEMEAFENGVVKALKVGEGETVTVGTVIALLAAAEETEEESEKTSAKGTGKAAAGVKEKKDTRVPEEQNKKEPKDAVGEVQEEEDEEEAGEGEEPGKEPSVSTARRSVRADASPAARQRARERELDIEKIRGTGPGGRIVLSDVERVPMRTPEGEAGKAPAARENGGKKSVKIRRIVARKMVESWQNVPHFFVTVAVDMTDVIRFRKDLRFSINDFIVAAAARALGEHPWVNSHWVDGEGVEQPGIHIALAVATDRGLYNPVLKDCGTLSLKEINGRARALVDRAHRGELKPEDMADGTFTISNMGMLGVESFSAIITPPQAAVLAVGTVKGEIILDEHEEPSIAPMLRLTLSADHRILDGADAAEFLTAVKSYLEAPITLVSCEYGNERS